MACRRTRGVRIESMRLRRRIGVNGRCDRSAVLPSDWCVEYPIQMLARSLGTRFQMGFARMTMHLAPAMKGVAFEASNDGLHILAESEMELALPGEVIRQIHGEEVEFGVPQVRYLHRGTLQEPVMWVRAAVPWAHTEPTLHDLITRDALIDEVDWTACRPTIRARAPLRALLGYPAALEAATQGTAELRMWLSHYAPVPPGPGKAA